MSYNVTGWRSFSLIIILVAGVLFSLLYASSYVSSHNADAFYGTLEAKKAEASIFRLRGVEPVCFTLGEQDFIKYSSLKFLTTEADRNVDETTPNLSVEENRYDGFGSSINSTEAVELVRQLEKSLNHTSYISTIRNSYADEVHSYGCNFQYGEKQYFLQIEFRSLTALDKYGGYVPISVKSEGISATVSSARFPDEALNGFREVVNPSSLQVYYTFNNTMVWTNDIGDGSMPLRSWLQLTLNTTGFEGEPITVSTGIPPGKSWDYRLWPNYRDDPTVYSYLIESDELMGDGITGKIQVHFYPAPCIDQQQAKSLYGQSGFAMKFPSSLPDGYEYKCGIHYDHFMLLQTYWNQSTQELEDFPNFATRDSVLNDGVIQIFAIKAVPLWYEWVNKTAPERLKELTEGENSRYYLEPGLIDIFSQADDENEDVDVGLVEAVAYKHNSYILQEINILEVYDHGRSEAYVLKGKVPLTELVKMAQSMYHEGK